MMLSILLCRSGKGTCKFKDGRIYEGFWKFGKIDGEGVMLNIDGTAFEGMFSQGCAEGNAKIHVHLSLVFFRRNIRRRCSALAKTWERNNGL